METRTALEAGNIDLWSLSGADLSSRSEQAKL